MPTRPPKDPGRVAERAKFRLISGLPLTTGQAAIIIGVDTRTVARWIRETKIDGTQGPGGQWIIPAAEVRRVIGAAALWTPTTGAWPTPCSAGSAARPSAAG
jgi:excisionase family DNA binding protein